MRTDKFNLINKITPSNSRSTNYFAFYLVGLAVLVFLARLGVNNSEDTRNARENFLYGSKLDFWGGMSSLVYGNVPNLFLGWQFLITTVQLLLAVFGINLLFARSFNIHKGRRIPVLILTYLLLFLSIQSTRDGLLVSLLTIGFGFISYQVGEAKNRFALYAGMFFLIIGMSFRPWLSFALVPIVLYLTGLKSKLKKLTIAAAITLFPLMIEFSSSTALNLENSFPQQQVMLMDFGATYCGTNNYETGMLAGRGLSYFSAREDFLLTVCQFYRTDTYLSMANGRNASTASLQSEIKLIPPGDSIRYEKLEHLWIEMILKDPITYIQNKVTFLTKLIIGSDTRGLSFFKETSTLNKLQALIQAPFDVAITLHIMSIAAFGLILLTSPIAIFVNGAGNRFVLERTSAVVLFSSFLWAVLSAVAYVGSNGRYTYTITLIGLALVINKWKR